VVGAAPDLTGLTGVHDWSVDGSVVACTVDPEALPEVLTALTAAGIRTLTSTPPTLEELFLDAYRGEGAVR
jgi:ABC-2 type transport system ATP-binding protein